MLYPINKLIEGHGLPLCVNRSVLIRDALKLMVEKDYSQLPIIDDNNELIGLFSEASFTTTNFHTKSPSSLVDIPVDHCSTPPKTLTPESDIFDALNLLEKVNAVVVVTNNKPIGIITNYDTSHFFRDLSEGLIFVEDIEVALRSYIEVIFPNANKLNAALYHAFKADKQDPTKPARVFENLSFAEHVQLITTDKNWDNFEKFFSPKSIFISYMNQVGELRNRLAHFRGKLSPIENKLLIQAKDWINSRPKPMEDVRIVPGTANLSPNSKIDFVTKGRESFNSFRVWLKLLRKEEADRIDISFSQINRVLGFGLPTSALLHRSWWANDPMNNPNSFYWVSAGWFVDDVNFQKKRLILRKSNKALYYTFFSILQMEVIYKRKNYFEIPTPEFDESLTFSSGLEGYSFGWVFGFNNIFKVELYIRLPEKLTTKNAFDQLLLQKTEIEEEIGRELIWDRLDKEIPSRINISIPFKIENVLDDSGKMIEWAAETMILFTDTFIPRIKELAL